MTLDVTSLLLFCAVKPSSMPSAQFGVFTQTQLVSVWLGAARALCATHVALPPGTAVAADGSWSHADL